MAYNFAEDNEASFSASASDGHGSHFDDLFNLDSYYHSPDTVDVSISHGSTSIENKFFEDLRFGRVFLDSSLFGTYANTPLGMTRPHLQPRASCQNLNSTASSWTPPKSQRLAYRSRPESMAISRAQLMALENKDHPQTPVPLDTFRCAFPVASPNTPPTTPQHNRFQSSMDSRKQSRQFRRAEKSSGGPLVYRPAISPNSQKTKSFSAYELSQQQKRVASPQLAQWTEQLRLLAVQSPDCARGFPISPPPSSRVDQAELLRVSPQTLGFEPQSDLFNPSSSSTTTTASSDGLTHPFLEDSSPSTMNSPQWNLDDATDLFGLKQQEPWDFAGLIQEHTSADTTFSRSAQICLDNSLDDPFSPIPDSSGLGISFDNDDFTSNPFISSLTTSKDPLDSSILPPSNSTSTPLPSVPFSSPTPDFCSLPVFSDLPATPTNTGDIIPSSSPIRAPKASNGNTVHKHRRTKSTPSLNMGKVRTSKANKDKGSGGGLGFVNYTPEDRTRILTGVAPSGSSKTKARREKEALDRRRKLSEAARRLIVEAGGDADAVDRELSD